MVRGLFKGGVYFVLLELDDQCGNNLRAERIQGNTVVPRRQEELTSDDKRELERFDQPPDQWNDDATIIAAKENKDPNSRNSANR